MPSPDQHRYVVIGAGAIGGCIGGVLARTGVPVVLVARGHNAEVLAATNNSTPLSANGSTGR